MQGFGVRLANVVTVVGCLALVAGCSDSPPLNPTEPSAPAWTTAMPVTPLPEERNGVEAVPVTVAQTAVIDAARAQAWGEASGSLERRLTDTDTSITDVAQLTFTTAGNESAFTANAVWGPFQVDIAGVDRWWWVVANDAYAAHLGDDEWSQGRCIETSDPVAKQWSWLAGPGAVMEAVTANLVWGRASQEVDAGSAQFPLAETGAVVGAVSVSAIGTPLPQRIEVDDLSGSGEVLFGEWSDTPLGDVTPCSPESTAPE